MINDEMYYKTSDKFTFISIILGLLFGFSSTLVVGLLYVLFLHFIPFLYANFVASAVYAYLIG